MGENEFKYLNKEEFSRLPRLHTLELFGNQISSIVDFTFRSAQLTRLSLGSNRIVRIDRYAFDNSTIQYLDLSHNKFESLDKLTFAELRTHDTLRHLDLSRNPKLRISPLIVILGENPQLEGLSLAYNDLEDLPLDLFELQGNLRYLNLSGNRLSELYLHQLSHLLNLQVLDLSHNRMKGLDNDIIYHLDRVPTFQELRLEGNPWHCDLCHIVPLLKWVQRTHFYKDGCAFASSGPACLRCTAPHSLQGRSLLSLEEQTLEWCSSGAEPISILSGVGVPKAGLYIGCVILMVILIAAAVIVIFKSRYHADHYYTHEGERPEIATPPVPPPQETNHNILYPETNGTGNNGLSTVSISHGGGSNGSMTVHGPGANNNTNGFDNLLFQQQPQTNGNGGIHHHYPPDQQQQQWIGPTTPCSDYNREKMIATIEEMTYETQLAYPELAPITLHPPPIRQQGHSSSSSPSSRSTPIYCCPSHHHHNNNNNGSRSDTPPRSVWNSSQQNYKPFGRY